MRHFFASRVFTENKLFLALLLTSTALLSLSLSQDTTVDIPAIAATEVDQILALEGKTVTVTGTINRTGKSGSGHNFLNFEGSKFVCFVPSSDLAKFPDGEPAETYKDKTVAVTGPIEIYQDKPEIVVKSPDQIALVAPEADEDKDEAKSPANSGETPAPIAEKTVTDPDQAVDWRKYFGE